MKNWLIDILVDAAIGLGIIPRPVPVPIKKTNTR